LLDTALQQLLAPTITALGYELWGIERLSQGTLIRIYIDSPHGISLDDCERVSYQISGILDVQDPIPNHYTLEVSSPGAERPLFTLEHFKRFLSNRIDVRLTRPLETRRHFTGILKQVADNHIIITVEEKDYTLPYELIDKAHLVFSNEVKKMPKGK
jgi:ribosome maturation factor RimP